MQFDNPLFEGILLQQYKRFLADIRLSNDKIITAHCPNSGSMLGVKDLNARVWVSKARDTTSRKYPYTWELIEIDGQLVSINTHRPNAIVMEALHSKKIPELASYTTIKREVKYGENSRIDFLLEEPGRSPCYLEVKSVHLKRQSHAEFPDAVTERGTKHLMELSRMAQQGARAVVLYVVQRPDCTHFSIASDIDPRYAQASQAAHIHGVEHLCYQCDISLTEITLNQKLMIQ